MKTPVTFGSLRWLPGAKRGVPAYLLFCASVAAVVYFSKLPVAVSTVAGIPLPLVAVRWPRGSILIAALGLAGIMIPLGWALNPDPSVGIVRTLIQIGVLVAITEGVREGVARHDTVIEKLAESEKRYRRLVESSMAVPWEVEFPSFRFTYVGPRVEELLGYPREEWYAENFWVDHLHPDDRDEAYETCKACAEDLEDHVLEYRMLRPDGRSIWIRDLASISLDRAGNLAGLRGVFLDVTQERTIRRELQESNDRLSRIWSAAQDGIVLFGSDGRTVIDANPTAIRLFGNIPGSQSGWPISHTYESDSEMKQSIARAIQETGSSRDEMTVTTVPDGIEIPVEVIASRVRIGGEDRVLAIVRDLSERRAAEGERRKLERQVQNAQRLEGLGLLAGGIAHDFNNLLTVIRANSSLVLGTLEDDDDRRELLDELDTAAVRATDLTHQMLAFSGRAPLDVRIEDLGKVARETANLVSSGISKKVGLSLDISESVAWVEADSGQLHQVVMNLITNAVDAIGGGTGTVGVRTGVVNVDADHPARSSGGAPLSPGPYAFIEVADDGVGMDEATRRSIFDPFFTTKFHGRGLGLAAVHGIVSARKGGFCVESEPARGTRFQVLFPLADAPAAFEEAVGSRPHTPTKQRCILVVDDEPGIRRAARRTLAGAGYDVVEAADGLEALDRVQSDPDIQLVLLDLTMPEMSGMETLARLSEVRPTLPVLLMSGYALEEVTRKPEAKLAAGFIHKPFEPEAVVDRIAEILAEKSIQVASD